MLDIHVIMIIESSDVVFFEDIFPYDEKKTRFLRKEHMKQHSGMNVSVHRQSMQKLNQEKV